jgi:hypothetical protein
MDHITFKDNGNYTISNTFNNKYIITFLAQYNIIKSIDNDFITISANNVETLENFKKKYKKDIDKYINKFIYDIGCQILLLEQYKFAIKYFSLSDILVINENIFLFISDNMLFELLEKVDINSTPYTYGVIQHDSIDVKAPFIPYELTLDKKEKYFYYTTGYYSFAKLLLYYFDIELKDINDTVLYFFCKRCLYDNPIDRIFLFI